MRVAEDDRPYWPLLTGSPAGALAALQELHRHLLGIGRTLDDSRWTRPTAAAGWSVEDQFIHLGSGDARACLALEDPPGFVASRDGSGSPDDEVARRRGRPRSELLDDAAQVATRLERLLAAVDADRVPWFGPPMRPDTFVVSRVMEWWAHGLDVTDALPGVELPTTAAPYVAALGVRTRSFAFGLHGVSAPPCLPELVLHDGDGREVLRAGDASCGHVHGPVTDFAAVVVRRRRVSTVGLDVAGENTRSWLEIAQAYAGPPGPGPGPRTGATA